ncbi:unnamed protein product [Effrenium voratum]|nr:unnamed protein product [Effrenium voratum]
MEECAVEQDDGGLAKFASRDRQAMAQTFGPMPRGCTRHGQAIAALGLSLAVSLRPRRARSALRSVAELQEMQETRFDTLKVRQGVLSNGMRYLVLRHTVPKGRFEAHLEFHVGSVDEQEDQRGMAHMLEHICFLGSSKRVQLQSSGLGMTSNACTDFNHTVYYVSIGSEHLGEGLKVLADIGFEPAFEPERVEKERAAVLSEAQMVNDCQYRMQTQFLSSLHGDNQIHVRFPIGLEQQIANWTIEELRRFHSRWAP